MNNKDNALKYLKSKGCNIDSHIIDYDIIAEMMINYTNQCGKPIEETKFNIIKTRRENLGLNLKDVSKYTGIAAASISKLEKGFMKRTYIEKLSVLNNFYNQKEQF